jgi:hypothetical protein
LFYHHDPLLLFQSNLLCVSSGQLLLHEFRHGVSGRRSSSCLLLLPQCSQWVTPSLLLLVHHPCLQSSSGSTFTVRLLGFVVIFAFTFLVSVVVILFLFFSL